MRGFVVIALAALMLGGCVSTLEHAYDERAQAECDQATRGTARGQCYDRVDDNRRDRDGR